MKVVIAGGVAAGMSAASKIIRMQKDAQVSVYEKGGYLSYGACGLSYYVADYHDEPSMLIARTRGEFEQMGVRTFLHHEIVGIDPAYQVVSVKSHETGELFRDTYDYLMIATGANAVVPPIVGAGKKGVYTLKTMENGLRLKEALTGYGVRDVVVIGGGNGGIEMADALRVLDKNVVCIEQDDTILPVFDREITALAERELAENGIEVKKGEKVLELRGGDSVSEVLTDRGCYPADAVIFAAGIRPNTQFLENLGMQLADNGAVVVDRYMRTSVPNIYAAGDCALVYDRVKEKDVYLPLGTAANKCGRIAGANICGAGEEFPGMSGSVALKVCSLQLGRTGLGETEAMDAGYYVGSVTVEARNHPAYYPGMEPLTVKVIYEKPCMRILGAQLAGRDGAALRTDIFAVAINAGMTTKQLGMTDLIYAPAFAGVWDAVQIACNAAK